jgi:hypothetical protein
MKVNVAPFDRGFRAWLGMMLLATPLLELETFPYNLIGLVPLLSGMAGFCPVYALFRRRPQAQPHEHATAT